MTNFSEMDSELFITNISAKISNRQNFAKTILLYLVYESKNNNTFNVKFIKMYVTLCAHVL